MVLEIFLVAGDRIPTWTSLSKTKFATRNFLYGCEGYFTHSEGRNGAKPQEHCPSHLWPGGLLLYQQGGSHTADEIRAGEGEGKAEASFQNDVIFFGRQMFISVNNNFVFIIVYASFTYKMIHEANSNDDSDNNKNKNIVL